MPQNKKINVMHLISALLTGGAENLLIDQTGNSSDKIEYTVVVMNNHIDEYLKTRLISTGCSIYFLNRKPGEINPKYLFRLLNITGKHKIQIIHAHNSGSKMWAILCKILHPKLKLVYTIHDTNIINKLNSINLYVQKKYIDMHISISKAVEKECTINKIKKICQIYNGIDVYKFLTINKKNNQKDSDFNIINVAKILHEKKGQDVLIKALKICKDRGLNYRCKIVGGVYENGCPKSYAYLTNLVKELQLENEVKFLGKRDDVPELLAETDLFVSASRYEGFGLVAAEAMAAGVPVISSNIDGPAEIVVHGETGLLFESENHEDLAEKIMMLKENFDLRSKLKINAREYVKQFDISIMCEKYKEVYKSLN